MGKSFFDEAEEAQGGLTKPLTGALVEITSIERAKTREKGLRMYVEKVKIKEPKKYKGIEQTDWIVVGTEDDPLAKRPETWNRSEGGPGRLKRLLTRSGTPLSDDDEEWMEAAEGREYVTPITIRLDDNGEPRSRLGLAFRATDEDCPEIGEADEDESPKGRAKKGAKGAAAGAKKLRGKRKEEDEDEDEEDEDEKKKKAKDEEEDDDDEPKKKSKKGKKDEEEDEEEDEKPKKKSKSKKDEDDEDEDD